MATLRRSFVSVGPIDFTHPAGAERREISNGPSRVPASKDISADSSGLHGSAIWTSYDRLMPVRTRAVPIAAIAALLAGFVTTANAQPAGGAIVSGSLAAAVDAAGANTAVAGSLGYRFTRVIGIGVEVTWMKLDPDVPSVQPVPPYGVIEYSHARADAVFFTTNMRVEVPTAWRRILPYAIGGGGPVSSNRSYTATFRPATPGVDLQLQSQATSETDLGLATFLGGGVSVLAGDHLSVDVDVREFYIRRESSGTVGRFGVGASYRF
jgi:Outer membrane protein beta-barrel domain